MRILLVAFHYPPSLGGIESATVCLAEALADRGHDVVVATATSGPASRQQRSRRGRLTVLRRPGPLAVLMRAWRSHVVIHSTISMTLAALLPFLPVRQLLWLHNRPTGGLLRRCFALRCRRAAVSRALAADWPSPVAVLPNPLAPAFCLPAFGPRDGDLLFVGRLVPVKGLDLLLRALPAVPGELTVVGDGPQREELVKLVDALGLASRVRWRGALPIAAVADELRRHRVLAVPSRDETYGLNVREGVACGCRVVATAVGALRGIAGGPVTLVPAEDPAAMAAALCEALAAVGPPPPAAAAPVTPAAVARRALALLR
jgi:glycogen(starch) synthase